MASNAVKSLYKLYVANIPWTVTSNELKKYFTKFGNIQSATIVFDRNTGLSRNYGFVVFSNKDSYEKTRSNTHRLEGNILKIEDTN